MQVTFTRHWLLSGSSRIFLLDDYKMDGALLHSIDFQKGFRLIDLEGWGQEIFSPLSEIFSHRKVDLVPHTKQIDPYKSTFQEAIEQSCSVTGKSI